MIPPSLFRFNFIGFGEPVSLPVEKNYLYLDVGNRLAPGVIDHHQLNAYSGSTVGLMLQNPDLMAGVAAGDAPVTIVLHDNPDLDCTASAYLAGVYLSTGDFPDGAELLAAYVDRVDSGHLGLTADRPFGLYSAYLQLLHRLYLCSWEAPRDLWETCVRDGMKIVEYVLREALAAGCSLQEVDAFRCPGLFSPRDRKDIEDDLRRYRARLPLQRAVRLQLPGLYGGRQTVDALLARNVQDSDDPDRCLFFKDWARSDAEFSQGGQGFVALSVYMESSAASPRRCILSVRPDVPVTLKGLGALLDEAESRARKDLYGADDRATDSRTGQPIPVRPGYGNADPWYDGRGHGFTIVDSPRSGTVLSPDAIEEIFLAFGASKPADARPVPARGQGRVAPFPSFEERGEVRVETAGERSVMPDIFISYPRKQLEWADKNVYGPLSARFGAERIFFDKHTLEAGAGWLALLADGVSRCRIFLPLYSREYFSSSFCNYELQLAIVRDPTGQRKLICPVLCEDAEIPNYCSLIQVSIDARKPDWMKDLEDFIRRKLD